MVYQSIRRKGVSGDAAAPCQGSGSKFSLVVRLKNLCTICSNSVCSQVPWPGEKHLAAFDVRQCSSWK